MPQETCKTEGQGTRIDCSEKGIQDFCSVNVNCEVPAAPEDLVLDFVVIGAIVAFLVFICICAFKKRKQKEEKMYD